MHPQPSRGKDHRWQQNRRLPALELNLKEEEGLSQGDNPSTLAVFQDVGLGPATRFFGMVAGLLDRIIYLAGRGIHLFIDFGTH